MAEDASAKPNEPTPDAPAPGADRPWQARRKHARHTMEIHVEIHELGEGCVPIREWRCTTSDISRGGLGLTSDRMVHTGRLLLLIMPDATGKGKRVMCGAVRSTTYEAGRGYVLGVEFTRVPDSTALNSWRREHGLLSAA